MAGLTSSDEFDKSKADTDWAAWNIGNVKVPEISQMKIKLNELVQQGVLTPEMADTFLQEATAYASMDPMARNELVQTIEDKGFDPQSRAALHELQGVTGEQERGSREAILQNAQERGVAGSGIEMASQLANQQGAATRMANQGFQAAADANQRQMQAVQGLASMDQQKAAAQDAINQFNAANRQSVENMNVGVGNAAQAQNLAEKQRIADTNVTTKNQEQLYNKNLYQQKFQNDMAKQSAYANTLIGGAQNATDIGKNKAEAANKWSDKNLKTDIQEVDPKEMLDNLTGYSYEYKEGEGLPEGEHVGIMSQDLKDAAPQAVKETPEGEQIDYSRLGGPMLAALASLNKRLNEVEENSDENKRD